MEVIDVEIVSPKTFQTLFKALPRVSGSDASVLWYAFLGRQHDRIAGNSFDGFPDDSLGTISFRLIDEVDPEVQGLPDEGNRFRPGLSSAPASATWTATPQPHHGHPQPCAPQHGALHLASLHTSVQAAGKPTRPGRRLRV